MKDSKVRLMHDCCSESSRTLGHVSRSSVLHRVASPTAAVVVCFDDRLITWEHLSSSISRTYSSSHQSSSTDSRRLYASSQPCKLFAEGLLQLAIMSVVSLLNVDVKNNPAPINADYEFEITFECLEPLQKGVIIPQPPQVKLKP